MKGERESISGAKADGIGLPDAPVLQGEILARTGEALDQQTHQALRHLFAWGPIRPSMLGEVIGTGASHVSKIIGRLDQDGLVERGADHNDGVPAVHGPHRAIRG